MSAAVRVAMALAAAVCSRGLAAADLDEARRHLDAERFGKALKVAERVLETSPDDPEAREIESSALIGERRFGAAFDRAEAWAARVPGDPRPLVLVARALGAQGDWATLRRVALRVKDSPAAMRVPVFRAVAREYCGGPGCEVAADLLADLASTPGDDPEHRLDVALGIAARGERDRALYALEGYLASGPADRDVRFALYATARALIRAAERGDPNPPVEGYTIVIPDGTPGTTLPVRRRGDPPTASAASRKPGTTGTATLQCVVLRTGHVVPVRVHGGTDRDFTSRSFAAILDWRYEPATKDGAPVPATFVVKTSWHTSGTPLQRGF